MKTIDVKGKKYVPVSERAKFFRNSPKYEGWSYTTEVISKTEEDVLMKCTVYDDKNTVRATGHAYEERNMSNINKTSYVENCETSAVGRALGFLGIGIDGDIASADEVADALERQELLKRKITKNEMAALKMLCDRKGSNIDDILGYYGIKSLEDMNLEDFMSANKILEKKSDVRDVFHG